MHLLAMSQPRGRRLLLVSWGLTLAGILVYLVHNGFQASDAGKFLFTLALTAPFFLVFRSSAAWAWAVAGVALALPALINIVLIGGLPYLWAPKTPYHGLSMYLLVVGLVIDLVVVALALRSRPSDVEPAAPA